MTKLKKQNKMTVIFKILGIGLSIKSKIYFPYFIVYINSAKPNPTNSPNIYPA